MSIAFRDGRPGDGAVLSKLFCESFAATFGHLYSKEDLAAFLCDKEASAFERELADPDFAFRLAYDGDVLAGYAKLGPNDVPGDTPPATLLLHQFYVLAPWQGTQVAPGLMAWTIDEARRRGAAHCQLTVFVDNHRARRFYEKRGFAEVGRYTFMVGNHEDDDRILRLAL